MPERCVDASVAVRWVVAGSSWRQKARKFLRDSLAARFTLIAPPLFEYETESALQDMLQRGVLTIQETDTALARLAAVQVQITSHPNMVYRAREIARQGRQAKIYDSLYAALAELRGCEFWTADRAFYDDVRSFLPFVKYLITYP
jgi:predicted nucleic acid-binding protein